MINLDQAIGMFQRSVKRRFLLLQGLDTGFKSALGDKARTHILWANAVEALQENVDAFHICHSVFMVKVYNHAKVGRMLAAVRQHRSPLFRNAECLIAYFTTVNATETSLVVSARDVAIQ